MQKLPDISTHFSEWYNEVIYQAELVDQAPVRGTVVIRPYGYSLWERIRANLDERIKETGHQNAAFPLLIPESFFKKEAEHIEGFAPELAIVTYAGGKKLEDPLVIRPTSETMVHYMFARWIKSWRDLPLKINQWANVMRWELRPRAFLRTTEFFWQEGHTAHVTEQEAHEEVLTMLQEYVKLATDLLAIPVITGLKSESEKFPGAQKTYTFEALMPDGKALQMGTSHLLSQNFATVFDMKYQNQEEKTAYPYLTSWGVTTRLIGAVVMVHGDQNGLVLPPRIAPIQAVIIPILKAGMDTVALLEQLQAIAIELKKSGIRIKIDDDATKTPGAKFYYWELRGVPIRIEIGPRDLEKGGVMVTDRLGLAKEFIPFNQLANHVLHLLESIQAELYNRAMNKRNSNWHKVEKLANFKEQLAKGGFYQAGWCGESACERELKKYHATTRCILEQKTAPYCFMCDTASKHDVLIAKSY